MPLCPLFLAQAEESSSGIFFWSIVLIVLVGAAFAGVMWVRKRLHDAQDVHGDGFTLSDLRRLHKAGQMTDEEFERAKEQMVAMLGKQKEATLNSADFAKNRWMEDAPPDSPPSVPPT